MIGSVAAANSSDDCCFAGYSTESPSHSPYASSWASHCRFVSLRSTVATCQAKRAGICTGAGPHGGLVTCVAPSPLYVSIPCRQGAYALQQSKVKVPPYCSITETPGASSSVTRARPCEFRPDPVLAGFPARRPAPVAQTSSRVVIGIYVKKRDRSATSWRIGRSFGYDIDARGRRLE